MNLRVCDLHTVIPEVGVRLDVCKWTEPILRQLNEYTNGQLSAIRVVVWTKL